MLNFKNSSALVGPGKASLRDRVAFFSQMNSIRSSPTPTIAETQDPIRKNSLTAEIDPDELGAFRRSGSVRDLARRFGSNTSLNSNSNNSTNFRRNVTHRKSWHFSTSERPIEIVSPPDSKPVSPVKPIMTLKTPNPDLIETRSVPLNDEKTTPDTPPAPVPRRRGKFISSMVNQETEATRPVSPVVPKIRKSSKLIELEEAQQAMENLHSPEKIRLRRKNSFGKNKQVNF